MSTILSAALGGLSRFLRPKFRTHCEPEVSLTERAVHSLSRRQPAPDYTVPNAILAYQTARAAALNPLVVRSLQHNPVRPYVDATRELLQVATAQPEATINIRAIHTDISSILDDPLYPGLHASSHSFGLRGDLEALQNQAAEMLGLTSTLATV